MAENKDYYKILGVTRSATEKEIKAAYRKLARLYHPDVNPGDSKAESAFQDINEAYEVLSNAESRTQYDQFGPQWKNVRPGGNYGPGTHGGQPFDFDFSNVDFGGGAGNIFEQMFGGGRRQARRPQKGGNSKSDLDITVEEAFSGTSKTLNLHGSDSKIDVKIPAGVTEGSKIRVKGKGEPGFMGGASGDLYLNIRIKPHAQYEVQGLDLHMVEKLDAFKAMLGGTLEVKTLKGKLDLKIPPGTQSGKKFRLSGFGLPGSAGKPDGNLILQIQISVPESLTEQQKERLKAIAQEIGSS